MTAIRHHVPDDILTGYATGTLPHAFDLVVATHVSMSDDARARLASLEAVGGAVLDGLEEVEIAADSLSRALAQLDETVPTAPVAQTDAVFPEPLRRIIGGGEEAVQWRNIAMGAKQCILHSDKSGTARLLYIPAGQAMPQHSHRGMEMTLVLKGAYRDETDRFARGDIEIADEEMNHRPVAESDEGCICLIATDARLKFSGLLPRIAQPFFGI